MKLRRWGRIYQPLARNNGNLRCLISLGKIGIDEFAEVVN